MNGHSKLMGAQKWGVWIDSVSTHFPYRFANVFESLEQIHGVYPPWLMGLPYRLGITR